MITDEKRKAFEQWAISSGLDFCLAVGNDGLYESIATSLAWDVWQAAQQVKQLQFEPCQLQSPVLPLAYLNAKSQLGRYLIHKYKDGGKTVYFFTGPNRVASDNETEAEAIAAANEDYQRKVLSCLVSGGE